MTSIVKKLSAATYFNSSSLKKIAFETDKSTPLYSLIGIAVGLKTGESQYGPWSALRGQFQGIALSGDKKGEVFVAPLAFAPEMLIDTVTAALANSDSVEFGFNVLIVKSENSAVGYEYGIEPLLEPSKNDPLVALTARIAGQANKTITKK